MAIGTTFWLTVQLDNVCGEIMFAVEKGPNSTQRGELALSPLHTLTHTNFK